MHAPLFWLAPCASLLALGFAAWFYVRMKALPEGTARMAEIALHVRTGAMAYLRQQYKVVGFFFVVLTAVFAWPVPSSRAGSSPGWPASSA
jgi:K(+)-stimulated pyrophosphate-energized sodium pump